MSAFYWIAFAAVTVLSSARLTRLATFDKFPPVEWLRNKYADWTDGTGWQLLAFCGYCASFWLTGLVVVWAYFADVLADPLSPSDHPLATMLWWMFNGTLGGSYLSAVFMALDADNEDEN